MSHWSISCLGALLFPLSHILVSIFSVICLSVSLVHFLSGCHTAPSITCPGATLLSLSPVLVLLLVHLLSGCPSVPSITCPGVTLSSLLSVQMSPLLALSPVMVSPFVLCAICPDLHMFQLLPARRSNCFFSHMSGCFVCSKYYLSLSPVFLLSLCCTSLWHLYTKMKFK